MKDLIEETANIFRLKAENKKLQLKVCLAENLPEIVHFDSLRLHQILSNFISNSLKFTDKGSIEFGVVVLSSQENTHKIKFAVKDTGIGIKAESVDKIFREFEQGDDRITKKFGGTGLGLAIVKRLANLLQGEVLAESNYGEGSTFYFTVEMKEAVQEPINKKEEKRYTQLQPLTGLNVLIAEDNDLNSFMLAHMLRSWKCNVTIVKNGRLALDAMNSDDFDLILMDTHMPVMSGFEAITEIRNSIDAARRTTTIITISASVMEHEQKAAFEVGADDVIGKPFNPIELYNKIVKACKLQILNS